MNANVKNQENKTYPATQSVEFRTIDAEQPIESEQDIVGVIARYLTDVNIAIRELVQNAIAACEKKHRECPTFIGIVKVWLEERADGVHLCIANNGTELDHASLMNLGKSSHMTEHNNFGTGWKTAVFFLCRTNVVGAFVNYALNNGAWTKSEAPYPSTSIKPCTQQEVAFIPEWAVTCIDVRLANPAIMEAVSAETIGYHCAWELDTHRYIHVHYCDTEVTAEFPSGRVLASSQTKCFINDKPHVVDWMLVDSYYAKPDDPFYGPQEENQGVRISFNGFFVKNFGHSIVKKYRPKKNDPKPFLEEKHPELNRVQLLVNFRTPAEESHHLPLINYKSDIDWALDGASAYRDFINSLVVGYIDKENNFSDVQTEEFNKALTFAEHVRIQRKSRQESGMAKLAQSWFSDIEEGNFHMFPEGSVSASDIKTNEHSRADLLLVKELLPDGSPDLRTVTTTVEYKAGKITPNRVGNALTYCQLLEMNYGVRPNILMYGSGMSLEAKRYAAYLTKQGFNIKCVHWKDRTPLWARHLWQD